MNVGSKKRLHRLRLPSSGIKSASEGPI